VALLESGCNLSEIASRLAENFIKQVVDDRFFHADPHPGNIRVRDGVIVWLDLGMMGRLSGADGMMFARYVEAIAQNDAEAVTDVLLGMGVMKQPPDRARLTADIELLLSKYRQMPLSSVNAGSVMQEFLAVARRHGISLPAGLTMLGRSVVILESVLTGLDPETNLLKIMSLHMRKDAFDAENMRLRLEKLVLQLSGSPEKLTAIPGQLSDALTKVLSGRATLNVNVVGQERESRARDRRTLRLSLAVVDAPHPLPPFLACHRLDAPPSGYALCGHLRRDRGPRAVRAPGSLRIRRRGVAKLQRRASVRRLARSLRRRCGQGGA
jgi:ubiquinone biosynthesis protein